MFPLEQSSKTLNKISCLWVWARMSSQYVLTLVQKGYLLFSSPGAGFYFCLLLRFFCFCFSSSMGLGRHPFHGCQPKGRLWNCQEGERLGLANSQMNGAPPPSPPPKHPSTHSVKEPRAAASLPPTPSPTSWVCSMPPLASSAYICYVTIWSI